MYGNMASVGKFILALDARQGTLKCINTKYDNMWELMLSQCNDASKCSIRITVKDRDFEDFVLALIAFNGFVQWLIT